MNVAHERAVLVQRRPSERLVLLERERNVLVDEQPERAEREPAQGAIEVRSAHGHAVRYSAVGPSPLWQPGHQYAMRAASPSGHDRIGVPQRGHSRVACAGRRGVAPARRRDGRASGAQRLRARREARRRLLRRASSHGDTRASKSASLIHMFPMPGDGALYLQRLSEGLSLGQRPQVARPSRRGRAARRGCPARGAVVPGRSARAPGRARAPPRRSTRAGRATGRCRRLPPAGCTPPPSLHPQVAAQRDAALEAEEEVLADRVDGLEALSVETLGDVLHGRARVRRLDGDLLPDEHLQPAGGTVERVSLGHAWKCGGTRAPEGALVRRFTRLGGAGVGARARCGSCSSAGASPGSESGRS